MKPNKAGSIAYRWSKGVGVVVGVVMACLFVGMSILTSQPAVKMWENWMDYSPVARLLCCATCGLVNLSVIVLASAGAGFMAMVIVCMALLSVIKFIGFVARKLDDIGAPLEH